MAAKPQASLLKWDEPEGGSLLGCVWIEPLSDNVRYLGSLATDPTLQNSGLGKILLSAAEQWAPERGGTRIRMTVVSIREALIAWYVRRGYRKTGETGAFSLTVTIGLARRSAMISASGSLRRISPNAGLEAERRKSASARCRHGWRRACLSSQAG